MFFRFRGLLRLIILSGAVVLGGCRVGPDYVEPDIATPDMWQRDLMQDFAKGRSNLHTWWTTFDDPLLDNLIERVREGNLDLQGAMERIRQGRAILGVTSGAKYPEIGATGQYKRNRISEGISEEIFPPTNRTDNFYTLGIDTFWEIDMWGRISRSVESARRDLHASVEEFRDVLVVLYAETASAYVEVRSLQERIRLAEGNAKLQSKTLKLTKDRLEAGIAPKLDVEQAELNLAVTNAAIPALKSSLAAAMNRLGVLVGDFPTSLYGELTRGGEVPVARLDISAGLPVDLLRQRPDIRRAERKLAAQTSQIGVATADLYPEFTLSGTFSVQAVNSEQLLRQGSISYSFGPQFRWNVFAGGRIRSRIELEESLAREALIDYEQKVLLALEEVDNAMVAYVRETERNGELTESVRAAEKSVELVKTLYLTGLTDFENVLIMQRSLFDQQDQLADSTGRISKNLIRVYKALGGGWRVELNDQGVRL
jgi:NodT family efflux transporter outer membrane factor (OMF) lipoprotein